MERNSFNENFEHFLRQNANNLRMQAKDKVWKNISNEMNRRRRRISITLTFVFFITSALGYYFVTNSIKPIPADTVSNITATTPVNTSTPVDVTSTLLAPGESPLVTEEQITPANEVVNTTPFTPAVRKNTSIVSKESIVALDKPITKQTDKVVIENVPEQVVESSIISPEASLTTLSEELPGTIVENNGTETVVTDKDVEENIIKTESPYSIESVTNLYKASANSNKKLTWQVSFAPTVSYRKLGENKSYLRDIAMQNAPSTIAPLYNINNAVTHKPDMGLELGVTSKYKVSNSVKILAGMQFNITRYDIKAFSAPYSLATIRLNSSSGLDSVRTFSSYSNTNGYQSNWLQNFYFQVSAPVGVEVKIRGTENMQFGIATTIQPTYLLSERAYVITTDYKNYAQVPWLTRRWNVNTNFQAFVAYSTGKMNWQVGPQIRYQLLSSFITQYPVKENLFDFGLKVGVSINK